MIKKIPIYDTFLTIESEGHRIGLPTMFFQTGLCLVDGHCDLCKNFIDGRNKKEPVFMSADDIINELNDFGIKNIVFGCGEFLVFSEFKQMFNKIYEKGFNITIETSGKYDIAYFKRPDVIIHVIASTDSSNLEKQMAVMKNLRSTDQLKVVIKNGSDVEILEYIISKKFLCTIYAVPVPGGEIKEIEFMNMVVYNSSMYPNVRVIIPQHLYVGGML